MTGGRATRALEAAREQLIEAQREFHDAAALAQERADRRQQRRDRRRRLKEKFEMSPQNLLPDYAQRAEIDRTQREAIASENRNRDELARLRAAAQGKDVDSPLSSGIGRRAGQGSHHGRSKSPTRWQSSDSTHGHFPSGSRGGGSGGSKGAAPVSKTGQFLRRLSGASDYPRGGSGGGLLPRVGGGSSAPHPTPAGQLAIDEGGSSLGSTTVTATPGRQSPAKSPVTSSPVRGGFSSDLSRSGTAAGAHPPRTATAATGTTAGSAKHPTAIVFIGEHRQPRTTEEEDEAAALALEEARDELRSTDPSAAARHRRSSLPGSAHSSTGSVADRDILVIGSAPVPGSGSTSSALPVPASLSGFEHVPSEQVFTSSFDANTGAMLRGKKPSGRGGARVRRVSLSDSLGECSVNQNQNRQETDGDVSASASPLRHGSKKKGGQHGHGGGGKSPHRATLPFPSGGGGADDSNNPLNPPTHGVDSSCDDSGWESSPSTRSPSRSATGGGKRRRKTGFSPSESPKEAYVMGLFQRPDPRDFESSDDEFSSGQEGSLAAHHRRGRSAGTATGTGTGSGSDGVDLSATASVASDTYDRESEDGDAEDDDDDDDDSSDEGASHCEFSFDEAGQLAHRRTVHAATATKQIHRSDSGGGLSLVPYAGAVAGQKNTAGKHPTATLATTRSAVTAQPTGSKPGPSGLLCQSVRDEATGEVEEKFYYMSSVSTIDHLRGKLRAAETLNSFSMSQRRPLEAKASTAALSAAASFLRLVGGKGKTAGGAQTGGGAGKKIGSIFRSAAAGAAGGGGSDSTSTTPGAEMLDPAKRGQSMKLGLSILKRLSNSGRSDGGTSPGLKHLTRSMSTSQNPFALGGDNAATAAKAEESETLRAVVLTPFQAGPRGAPPRRKKDPRNLSPMRSPGRGGGPGNRHPHHLERGSDESAPRSHASTMSPNKWATFADANGAPTGANLIQRFGSDSDMSSGFPSQGDGDDASGTFQQTEERVEPTRGATRSNGAAPLYFFKSIPSFAIRRARAEEARTLYRDKMRRRAKQHRKAEAARRALSRGTATSADLSTSSADDSEVSADSPEANLFVSATALEAMPFAPYGPEEEAARRTAAIERRKARAVRREKNREHRVEVSKKWEDKVLAQLRADQKSLEQSMNTSTSIRERKDQNEQKDRATEVVRAISASASANASLTKPVPSSLMTALQSPKNLPPSELQSPDNVFEGLVVPSPLRRNRRRTPSPGAANAIDVRDENGPQILNANHHSTHQGSRQQRGDGNPLTLGIVSDLDLISPKSIPTTVQGDDMQTATGTAPYAAGVTPPQEALSPMPVALSGDIVRSSSCSSSNSGAPSIVSTASDIDAGMSPKSKALLRGKASPTKKTGSSPTRQHGAALGEFGPTTVSGPKPTSVFAEVEEEFERLGTPDFAAAWPRNAGAHRGSKALPFTSPAASVGSRLSSAVNLSSNGPSGSLGHGPGSASPGTVTEPSSFTLPVIPQVQQVQSSSPAAPISPGAAGNRSSPALRATAQGSFAFGGGGGLTSPGRDPGGSPTAPGTSSPGSIGGIGGRMPSGVAFSTYDGRPKGSVIRDVIERGVSAVGAPTDRDEIRRRSLASRASDTGTTSPASFASRGRIGVGVARSSRDFGARLSGLGSALLSIREKETQLAIAATKADGNGGGSLSVGAGGAGGTGGGAGGVTKERRRSRSLSFLMDDDVKFANSTSISLSRSVGGDPNASSASPGEQRKAPAQNSWKRRLLPPLQRSGVKVDSIIAASAASPVSALSDDFTAVDGVRSDTPSFKGSLPSVGQTPATPAPLKNFTPAQLLALHQHTVSGPPKAQPADQQQAHQDHSGQQQGQQSHQAKSKPSRSGSASSSPQTTNSQPLQVGLGKPSSGDRPAGVSLLDIGNVGSGSVAGDDAASDRESLLVSPTVSAGHGKELNLMAFGSGSSHHNSGLLNAMNSGGRSPHAGAGAGGGSITPASGSTSGLLRGRSSGSGAPSVGSVSPSGRAPLTSQDISNNSSSGRGQGQGQGQLGHHQHSDQSAHHHNSNARHSDRHQQSSLLPTDDVGPSVSGGATPTSNAHRHPVVGIVDTADMEDSPAPAPMVGADEFARLSLTQNMFNPGGTTSLGGTARGSPLTMAPPGSREAGSRGQTPMRGGGRGDAESGDRQSSAIGALTSKERQALREEMVKDERAFAVAKHRYPPYSSMWGMTPAEAVRFISDARSLNGDEALNAARAVITAHTAGRTRELIEEEQAEKADRDRMGQTKAVFDADVVVDAYQAKRRVVERKVQAHEAAALANAREKTFRERFAEITAAGQSKEASKEQERILAAARAAEGERRTQREQLADEETAARRIITAGEHWKWTSIAMYKPAPGDK